MVFDNRHRQTVLGSSRRRMVLGGRKVVNYEFHSSCLSFALNKRSHEFFWNVAEAKLGEGRSDKATNVAPQSPLVEEASACLG